LRSKSVDGCLDEQGGLRRDLAEAIASRIRGARRFAVVTGSGVSAASGIPTFRDAQTGFWARFRPEDLATPEAFAEHPGRVWAWYQWRRRLVANARPNAGHDALADLETRVPWMTLITQNVDGLHQRAGSREVIEFHGNVLRSRCAGMPSHTVSLDGEADLQGSNEDWSGDQAAPPPPPPRCEVCGEWLRPDVVWFGEPIPQRALLASTTAVLRADVLISAGTSAQVYPAASLARLAREQQACVIEVNLDDTPLSAEADYVLRGESSRLLPALVSVLGEAAGY
jgi:NAD-dependent deacetylase